MHSSRTLAISIACGPSTAYDCISNPENLPQWAAGLAKSVRREGGEWIVETPEGEARVRFAERNAFGVLDHDVLLATGVEVHVPMRVVPNGGGCEVMLTIFRQPEMTDEDFARDAAMVVSDLSSLRALLERG